MSTPILVVTLNPALDVTHELARVDWAGVNRPDVVRSRPGGKGLNVARTLHALGAGPLVLGLAGGRTGTAVGAKAATAGLRTDFTKITDETRRTFAVVDRERGHTALFNEPGPQVSAAEYASFLARYQAALPASAAVVLTGSLPRGLAADCYAELAGYATAADVPVLLDAEGQPLLDGLVARPAIVKPNLAELSGAVGRPLTADSETGRSEIVAAASELRETGNQAGAQADNRAGHQAGVQAVVVSLGEHGLIAVTGQGAWRAWPRAVARGNPTGAGDAVVAGLALGLAEGRPWPDRLRQAAALGAATAAAPVAGEFNPGRYEQALAEIEVDQLEVR
ncbi:MAG TPA: 1-phosphofructokinase family hexose kinase [Streptosporangiaceae bacterium]|jgi:tagatose 6-phosphate kinase